MCVTSPDALNQIAAAAAEGDDVGVRRLVELTQPMVWRLHAALGDLSEDQDLVQETYLRAIPALASYRGDADVQVWLLSTARRMCADHVRRRQRQRRLITRLVATATSRPSTLPDSFVG